RLEGRDRLWRAGQQPNGILGGCTRRSEPVPGDDAEVATATASMRPPQVAMRIGRLPSRYHAARPSALIGGDHLDGVQIIRGEPKLAAEEAKGATDHVPAHSDRRMLAEWYHDSPHLEQRLEGLAHRGAGLDGHGAPFRVVVHALHRRDVDEHPHLGVRHESLEAVAA